MKDQHSLILTFIILLYLPTHLALSCKSISDCRNGFVCSTAPLMKGKCVYGCHDNYDCAIDTTPNQNQKCDKTSPYWSCTCGSKSACPEGVCFNGHCTFSCLKDSECVEVYGDGYVCSTVRPTNGTCIYACHYGSDCASDNCNKTKTPHWLCTCGNKCKGV
ncbi:11839_t:CDS:1, partial [Acaulospora morrowiae]